MLQMPTSTFDMLSSSSKSLDRFFGLICVGIQMVLTLVLSNESEVINTVRATATVKVVLQPTKCALSNGTGSFPYVTAMGYAAIMSSGVVYILRAKRFSIVQQVPTPASHADKDPGTGDRPPSPPSDADTSSNAKKCLNKWLQFLLILLVSTVLLSLGAGIFVAHLVPSLRVLHPLQSLGAASFTVIERILLYEWRPVATKISLHILEYFKVLLLALISHSACILLSSTFRRARHQIILSIMNLSVRAIGILTLATPVAVSLSQLSWIFWMSPYFNPAIPRISEIHQILLQVPSQFEFFATLRPINSAVNHCSSNNPPRRFNVSQHDISRPPRNFTTLRAMIWHLSRRERWFIYATGFFYVTRFTFACVFVISACFAIVSSFLHIQRLPREYEMMLWTSLERAESRPVAGVLIRLLAEAYNNWKAKQIEDFAALVSDLHRAFGAAITICWETWGSLTPAQQALIILPVALFYVHLEIIPPARKFGEAGNVDSNNLLEFLLTRSSTSIAGTDTEEPDEAQTLSRKYLARNVAPDPSMTHSLPDHRVHTREYTLNTIHTAQVALANIPAEYTPNVINPAQVVHRRVNIIPAEYTRSFLARRRFFLEFLGF
ncbi:hypothetical protein C8F04DRAFT_1319016 [Mycena alexandri]|uniref:Uncharacterized protein n=1 Tax=Mycena alexandri TaxID=1745969 RepID=A0AAD6XBR8_9AGAR|nr:hypothetical protein C8F04DRAFT_1319016 [Mycena alexandri]